MIYKLLLIALVFIPLDTSADNKEPILNKVRVQLKWFHQFQFAGF
jgi:hypothetical protein